MLASWCQRKRIPRVQGLGSGNCISTLEASSTQGPGGGLRWGSFLFWNVRLWIVCLSGGGARESKNRDCLLFVVGVDGLIAILVTRTVYLGCMWIKP